MTPQAQERAALVALARETADKVDDFGPAESAAIILDAIDAALSALPSGGAPAGPCRLDLDPEGGVTCREASTDVATYCRRCVEQAEAQPTPIYEPMGVGEREYLHSVIAAFHAVTDPEAHPDLDALANGVLLPCDTAGRCVPPKPSGGAEGAEAALRQALDAIQSPLAIDGENHMAAVYFARHILALYPAPAKEPKP